MISNQIIIDPLRERIKLDVNAADLVTLKDRDLFMLVSKTDSIPFISAFGITSGTITLYGDTVIDNIPYTSTTPLFKPFEVAGFSSIFNECLIRVTATAVTNNKTIDLSVLPTNVYKIYTYWSDSNDSDDAKFNIITDNNTVGGLLDTLWVLGPYNKLDTFRITGRPELASLKINLHGLVSANNIFPNKGMGGNPPVGLNFVEGDLDISGIKIGGDIFAEYLELVNENLRDIKLFGLDPLTNIDIKSKNLSHNSLKFILDNAITTPPGNESMNRVFALGTDLGQLVLDSGQDINKLPDAIEYMTNRLGGKGHNTFLKLDNNCIDVTIKSKSGIAFAGSGALKTIHTNYTGAFSSTCIKVDNSEAVNYSDFTKGSMNTTTSFNGFKQISVRFYGSMETLKYDIINMTAAELENVEMHFDIVNQYSLSNVEWLRKTIDAYNHPNIYTFGLTGPHSITNMAHMLTDTKFDFSKELNTVGVTRMEYMFMRCKNLKTLKFIDTSLVTSMQGMFNGCTILDSVPSLKTSNVTDMSFMFQDCASLTTVPLFDTSNVTNTSNMFFRCVALLVVPALNTSKVTIMYSMFNKCTALTVIPALDISKATTTLNMFKECSSLENIPDLDLPNCTNSNTMFQSCTKLKIAPYMKFAQSGKISIATMFDKCTSLVDTGRFEFPFAHTGDSVFNGCTSLTTVRSPRINNVDNEGGYNNFFNGCYSLKYFAPTGLDDDIDLSIATSMPTGDLVYLFRALEPVVGKTISVHTGYASSLTMNDRAIATDKGWTIDFKTVHKLNAITMVADTTGVDTFTYSFTNVTGSNVRYTDWAQGVSDIPINGSVTVTVPTKGLSKYTVVITGAPITMVYNYPNVKDISIKTVPTLNSFKCVHEQTSLDDRYDECPNIQAGTIEAFELSGDTSITSPLRMFWISNLSTIRSFNMSKSTTMISMFYGCKSLTSIPYMDSSKVTNLNSMCNGCSSLTSIPLLDISNATDSRDAFNGCAFTDIPLLNTSNIKNMGNMFKGCKNLITIPLLNTSSATIMYSMFEGCTSLATIPLINMSKVTNSTRMFFGCTSLTTIPELDVSKSTVNTMFYDCTSLTSVSKLDVSASTSIQDLFGGCVNLVSIPTLNCIGAASNMGYVFAQCKKLLNANLENTGAITSMNLWFQGCESMQSVSIGDTSKVTIMDRLFERCNSLKVVPVLDARSVSTMLNAFDNLNSCTSFLMTNIKADINLSKTALDKAAIIVVFGNLATISGKTITIKSAIYESLSVADKAIATDKGWVIASV